MSNGSWGAIGFKSGATGTVMVDGTGSTWTNSDNLYVGYSGTGTLTVRNGGSVSAPIMFIAVQGGSIGTLNIGAAVGQAAVAPGTLSAASVNFGSGNGQLVFNHTGANYTFAPVIIGSGAGTRTVRVEGGTTILTATSTYTGPTTSMAARWRSTARSPLGADTVNAGGTLGGNGTVGNTTINGGTLAPGNSIGTLTVAGQPVFTAASSYLVEVSPANADRTNVTGTATLGGATVNASLRRRQLCHQAIHHPQRRRRRQRQRSARPVNTNLPANFTSSAELRRQQRLSRSDADFAAAAPVRHAEPQSAERRQRAGQFLQHDRRHSAGVRRADAGRADAGLRRDRDGIAADHVRRHEPVHGPDDRPVHRGPRRCRRRRRRAPLPSRTTPVPMPRTASASERARSLCRDVSQGAADIRSVRRSAGACGRPALAARRPPTAMPASDRTPRPAASTASRPAPIIASRRTPWPALRWPAAAPISASQWRGSGRSDLFQAGAFVRHTVGAAYLTGALAYGWQDITTDRTVTVAGVDRLRAQFNANAFSGRIEGGYRFVTPWIGGIG